MALNRSERVFYTYPGLTPQIPEIAAIGTDGGEGFTADGYITVGADGALCTIDCRLPPEENPGQATGLIESFVDVESVGEVLTTDTYKAFKRAGICAPRRDPSDGLLFQSGITTSLTPSLVTQARMKMSDFINDSIARALGAYSKKLATLERRRGAKTVVTQFLDGLLAPTQPGLQRIAGYDVRETQMPAQTSKGITIFGINVANLASMDAIGIVSTVGEGVSTSVTVGTTA